MAAREEEPKQEQAPEAAASAEGGGSILGSLLVPDALVRMGIGILVLGGMTAGAFYLVTDVIGPAVGPVETISVAGTASDADVPPVTEMPGEHYVIDDLVLNPAGSRGKRFLRLGVALEAETGAGVVAELTTRSAQIRDLLIRKFSSRTIDELSDPTVREEIRLTCIDEINANLAGGKISNLYFTDYVLQ